MDYAEFFKEATAITLIDDSIAAYLGDKYKIPASKAYDYLAYIIGIKHDIAVGGFDPNKLYHKFNAYDAFTSMTVKAADRIPGLLTSKTVWKLCKIEQNKSRPFVVVNPKTWELKAFQFILSVD